ncbi:MAG: hypothetical protein HY921_03610 [Elusimicrobia bacterium]|nr:hypothetical protein [Elusimicrobiota bacterium]
MNELELLSSEDEGVQASLSLALEPEQGLAKIQKMLASGPEPAQKARLKALISEALDKLRGRGGIDLVYNTTRTLTPEQQELTLELGFKVLGIFPSARAADSRKINGLAVFYAPEALKKRYSPFPLHPAIFPFFELARAQCGLEPLPLAARPALAAEAPALPPLEMIEAPRFVAERFRRLKARRSLSVNFYPFQVPNVLFTSPDQSVEVFAWLHRPMGFATIVAEHLTVPVSPVELYRRVVEALRSSQAGYIEVINDAADAAGIECILQAGFVPCGYFPALKKHVDLRRDYVVFARTFEPFSCDEACLSEPYARLLAEFRRAQASPAEAGL